MSRTVLVLGMHRSGTSCLAGSLQELGLVLGDVITVAPNNAKGNRENKRIMDLHNDVLRENGGSWDQPPPRSALRWSRQHRARRDAIIAEYGNAECWGFKDPRTLLTLDGWLEVLADPTFVGTFRHPGPVVRSLVKRNGQDPQRWLSLWRDYNERLLSLHEKGAFPIVDFDLGEAAYRARVADVAERLGLRPQGVAGFFEPTLRHHRTDDGSLPDDLAALYARLREVSAA
jgi:hypothetical protein